MISIGYVAGMSVMVVLILGCLAVIVFAEVEFKLIAAFVLAVVLGIGGLALWPPFDMEYHRYKPVDGTIDQIQARMVGDGDGGTTQMFAVRFRGVGTMYRCDDSRCSLLKSGDRLWLRCIREWQYAAESGWKCNYVRSEQAS